MKIKITMVSGKEYKFENSKFKNIPKWLTENFKGTGRWFMISEKCKFVINTDLIETIEEESEK